MLFASFEESFGNPLFEAASHRLPILAREAPMTQGLLGPHGIFFTTVDDLRNGIRSLENPVTYAATQQRVAQIRWLDWHSAVDSTLTDILRPPQERRQIANLFDRSLMLPLARSAERGLVILVPQADPGPINGF